MRNNIVAGLATVTIRLSAKFLPSVGRLPSFLSYFKTQTAEREVAGSISGAGPLLRVLK